MYLIIQASQHFYEMLTHSLLMDIQIASNVFLKKNNITMKNQGQTPKFGCHEPKLHSFIIILIL